MNDAFERFGFKSGGVQLLCIQRSETMGDIDLKYQNTAHSFSKLRGSAGFIKVHVMTVQICVVFFTSFVTPQLRLIFKPIQMD